MTNDASFAKEVGTGIATRELGRKQLDGDGTVDKRIIAANHTAVGTGTDRLLNLITANVHVRLFGRHESTDTPTEPENTRKGLVRV